MLPQDTTEWYFLVLIFIPTCIWSKVINILHVYGTRSWLFYLSTAIIGGCIFSIPASLWSRVIYILIFMKISLNSLLTINVSESKKKCDKHDYSFLSITGSPFITRETVIPQKCDRMITDNKHNYFPWSTGDLFKYVI